MPLNAAALNVAATAVAGVITHIGLTNGVGAELSGGGYARQPVAWTAATDGDVSLAGDETFSVPAGGVVAGWQGYSALTGGTAYGITPLTQETFSGAGTYVLAAAGTAIDFDQAMPQEGLPVADLAVGQWGVSPLWSKLDDGAAVADAVADVDMVLSTAGTISTCELQLSALAAPEAGTVTITYRYAKNAAAGNNLTLTVSLLQFGQLLFSDAAQTVSGTLATTRTWTLTTSQQAAITDWDQLGIRLVASASGGNTRNRRAAVVHRTYLSAPDPAPIVKVGGSIAPVAHTTAGSGTTHRSGSGTASVTSSTTGAGATLVVDIRTGGTATGMHTTTAAGTAARQGAAATVQTAATGGSGQAGRRGAATATVAAATTGSGSSTRAGGSSPGQTVTPTGAGTKTTTAGSTATHGHSTAAATGGQTRTGSANANVGHTTTGSGVSSETPEDTRTGSASARATAATSGTGQRQATGAAATGATHATAGSGWRTARSGSSCTHTHTTTGAGTAARRGGTACTSTAAPKGTGTAARGGQAVCQTLDHTIGTGTTWRTGAASSRHTHQVTSRGQRAGRAPRGPVTSNVRLTRPPATTVVPLTAPVGRTRPPVPPRTTVREVP